MENKKSAIVIIAVAVVIAIVLGVGFATHWFTMDIEEHTEMKKVSVLYVI